MPHLGCCAPGWLLTPSPIKTNGDQKLGAKSQPVPEENGTDYLRDVAAALVKSNMTGKPNLLAIILVKTHGR